VLRELGWEILRVWSTDWWIDREGALTKLDADLRGLLKKSRPGRAEGAVRNEAAEAGNSGDRSEEQTRVVAVAAAANGEYRNNLVRQGLLTSPFYELQPDPVRFFERSYDALLSSMVAEVIETEGPVLDEALARRIARAHGWQRTGARITKRVTRIATRAFRKTKEDVGTFFWPVHLEAGTAVPFRPDMDRSVDEICLQELVSVASLILRSGRTGEEAIIAIARQLGVQRVGGGIRRRLDVALERAQAML
jgi:hypothetical protein